MSLLINITEAEKQFSTLIQQTLQGEEIIITQEGIPVVRLLPALPKTNQTVNEREKKLKRAQGFFTHIPTSSEVFAQKKQQEIDLENTVA